MIDWIKTLDIATAVMLAVMFLGAWILWKVQRDPNNDFNFEDMLRDDAGKPSSFRLAVFISLAVSTWVMMYIVLKTNAIDSWIFVAYLSIWSGAKVAETALQAYGNSKSQGGYGGYRSRSYRNDSYESHDENNESVDEDRPRRRYSPPPR